MSASNTTRKSHPSQRRYPPEIRERAVRMVREALKESDRSHGVVTRVAGQLGLGSETLRKWVKQAEVDDGERPGGTSEGHRRITELGGENRGLRRANQNL